MNLGLGYSEIAIILVLALIVVGPKRLPMILRTIGQVMGQLRKASDDLRNEIMFSDEIGEFRDAIDGVKDAMNPLKPPPVPPKLRVKPKQKAERQSDDPPVPEKVESEPNSSNNNTKGPEDGE